MKTTIYSTFPYERPYLEPENKEDFELLFREESLTKKTASLAKGSDAVAIFTSDDASADVLEELKNLGIKYIASRSMGLDHIDTDKAKELGLKVANVPHYSPYSVAEHSVALMLALNRKLITASKKVREYDFRLDGLVGFNMHGKTVGILGAGEIGAITAKILFGFGCRLIIYDVEEDRELVEKYEAEYADLDEMCSKADIISIHAPLTEKTKHLVNKDLIGKMKKGVMIINAGRGGICKTEDLIEGLKSEKIGYLGLDVYEHEKGLFFEDRSKEVLKDDLFVRLLGFKNVIVTAHQAFLTKEALQDNMQGTLDNLKAWAKNEKAENELK